jgi:hypothetical protein
MSRIVRVPMLLLWLVFGLALILVPWTDLWEANYFLLRYPGLGLLVKNAFLRGSVSGLGFMNVLLALEGFRHRTISVASRT